MDNTYADMQGSPSPDMADPASQGTMLDAVKGAVNQKSGVDRDNAPDVSPSDSALVKRWMGRIAASENHHKKPFKRMRRDMDFAYKYGIGKQWDGQTEEDDRYIANFTQRHITSRVSALYAKNPKAIYKRRPRLDFALWDGSVQQLQGALQQLQQATTSLTPAPPQTVALLQDIQQGVAFQRRVERIGRTLEMLFNYYMGENTPEFKEQMKQLVRRTITCGVGYVRVGYQRLMEKKAENQARLADAMSQLKNLERLRDDMMDGEFDEDSPEMAELRATIAGLQADTMIIREGLTFDFPRSTAIIFDTKCTQIVGWIGADWVAEKWYLSPTEIQEIWQVDIGTNFTRYEYTGVDSTPRQVVDYDVRSDSTKGLACVYKVYDKKTGTFFVVTEGYKGFLEAPHAPDIRVEQFFPIEALAFNQVEHEEEVFPPSDVTLIMNQQKEHNRSRESLRQHRIANRPLYAAPNGAFEDSDMNNLSSYPAHAVVMLDGLKEGQDVGTVLQPVKKIAVDPNLYESQPVFDDVLKVVGSQEANIGGTNDASATQSSIAETSRLSSLASNVDDLDGLLTKLAKMSGQVMFRNVPKANVLEIVGPGASWPELTYEQVIKEVWLEVQAGSSGRPNKAQDLANFERAAPFVLQIPGITPDYIGKYVLRLLDDDFDIEEAITAGMPSISSMNSQVQMGTGNPATDPNQQGAQGANNAPAVPGSPHPSAQGVRGPQPGFPTGAPAIIQPAPQNPLPNVQ